MNTEISNQFKDETINIKKYFFLIVSNWYWLVASSIIALTIAFIVNRYSTPSFIVSSSMIVSLEDNSELSSIISDMGIIKKKFLKNSVENELPVIQSYSLAKTVIEQLQFDVSYFGVGNIRTVELYKSSPFRIEYDSAKNLFNLPVTITFIDDVEYELRYISPAENKEVTSKVIYGQKYVDSCFSFKLFIKEDIHVKIKERLFKSDFSFVINNIDALATSYQSILEATLVYEKANVVDLTIKGTVPEKMVDYLNKLSETYIQRGLDEKNKSYENTIAFIEEQLNRIVDSLEIAENNLEAFRKSNNIIDLGAEGKALFEKVKEIQERKAQLDIKMKYFAYILSYVESKKDFQDVVMPSVIGIQDNLLNSLIQKLSELYSEKRLVEFSSQANNPSLEFVKIKIENTREALVENVTNVIKGAKIEETGIADRLFELDKEIKLLPATERRMINIQRKFELNNNIYTFLLEKKAEAGMAKASNMPTSKIIDKAYLNNVKKISPKISLNYLIALFLGLLFPVVFIIARSILFNRITDLSDVEDSTKLPILGAIPHNNGQEENVVQQSPKSTIAEAFRHIRSNLRYLTKNKEKIVIAVSSTMSGEGKTFTALNLSSIYALSKKRTVIVGLDLRRPKLHQKFGIENKKGITTILIGHDTYKDCIHTITDYLHFIPSGPIAPNPAELIETTAMRDLLITLSEEYDVVILDTPPLALVSDAMILQSLIDATVFVVRQNYSDKDVLEFVNDLKDGDKIANPGILINDMDFRRGYGYGYGRYGRRYGKYRYYNYGYYEETKRKRLSGLTFTKES